MKLNISSCIESRVQSLFLLFVSSILLFGCSEPPRDVLTYPKTGPIVERGRELVKGVASCGFCHGAKREPNSLLIGGLSFYDSYGEVKASNLTPSKDGIKDWSGEDIIEALRTSQNKDKVEISYEAHSGYEWVSDTDLISIVSYLKTIPPVKNHVDRRDVGIIEKNTSGFLVSPKSVKGYVPEIDKSHVREYGKYLVERVARCTECHNSKVGVFGGGDYLAGGRLIKNENGEKEAPSIIINRAYNENSWKKDTWREFFRKGLASDGKVIDANFCPTKFYKTAPDKDIEPMIEYLASLE